LGTECVESGEQGVALAFRQGKLVQLLRSDPRNCLLTIPIKQEEKMSKPDFLVHESKDTVGAIVVEGIEAGQELSG